MGEIGTFFALTILAILAVLVFIAIGVGAIYVSVSKKPNHEEGSRELHD